MGMQCHRELAVNPMTLRITADSSDSNDGIESPRRDRAHAIFATEATALIRVCGMREFSLRSPCGTTGIRNTRNGGMS